MSDFIPTASKRSTATGKYCFRVDISLSSILVAKSSRLSGSAFKAGFGYIVGLPVAAYLTWQGKLIEGRGITPSISVPQPPEQLLAGEDPQMRSAFELARQL